MQLAWEERTELASHFDRCRLSDPTGRELDIALACDAKVVGVNNRNLHTFKLDLETTARIARQSEEKCAKLGRDPPMILALR